MPLTGYCFGFLKDWVHVSLDGAPIQDSVEFRDVVTGGLSGCFLGFTRVCMWFYGGLRV